MTATVSSKIEEAAAEEFGDPKPPGMGPFGKIGTVLLFALLMMNAILLKLTTWWIGLIFAVIVFPLLFATCVKNPRTGQTKAQAWNRKRIWKRGEKDGSNKYLAGPVSLIGRFLLPGFLTQSLLHTFTARNFQETGLVEIPAANVYGIGVSTNPDGSSLLPDETLLQFSDRWGRTLKFLGNEAGVIQSAVTIQTRPDPGDSERDRIQKSIKPGASDYSRKVMLELAKMTPPGAAVVDSYLTVTYDAMDADKRRNPTQMAVALAPRLPALLTKLTEAGAGHCQLMTQSEICDAVQSAYDPGAARHIARMRELGIDTGARWDRIGPPRADKRWDCYRHAGGVSVTYTMTDIEGSVNLTTLEPLVRGNPNCDVLRITILYRHRSPQEKNRLAQKDFRHAQFHTMKTDHTAGDAKRVTSTTKTALDTARGDGLVDISVIITGTVLDKVEQVQDENGNWSEETVPAMKRVPAMVAAIEQAAPQAMLAIIRQDGGHGATFAAGLGMGVPLVPGKHSKLSVALQEDL